MRDESSGERWNCSHGSVQIFHAAMWAVDEGDGNACFLICSLACVQEKEPVLLARGKTGAGWRVPRQAKWPLDGGL